MATDLPKASPSAASLATSLASSCPDAFGGRPPRKKKMMIEYHARIVRPMLD